MSWNRNVALSVDNFVIFYYTKFLTLNYLYCRVYSFDILYNGVLRELSAFSWVS